MNIDGNTFLCIYVLVFVFILGTVLASFMNCIADRYSKKEKWWVGRSKCDTCGHTLSFLDLIPVISYISLKGRCRYCDTKLSKQYVLTEISLGILFVIFVITRGIIDFELINELGLVTILFGLSLCDLKTYEIPDGFIIFGIVWWLIFSLMQGYSLHYYISFLIGALIISGGVLVISLCMSKLLNKDSMGGGDIKLLFLVTLYLGLFESIFNLMLSCIIGLFFIIFMRKEKIPFGPAISLATYISLIYGVNFLIWYTGLLV